MVSVNTNGVSRRGMLTLLAATSALSACSTLNNGQAAQVLQQAASDVNQIAVALKTALPSLSNIPSVPAAVVAKVGQYIADIQTVAANVTLAASAAVAQPQVQQLETDLNTIVATLAGLPIPPPFGPALQAAAVLLPVIEAAVGLVVTQLNVPAPPPAKGKKMALPPMSPPDARNVLNSIITGAKH